jgi:hypothetical protein
LQETLCCRPGSEYTLAMDSVRFGRVLGIGARLAAKTVMSAVDAAAAPNPSAKTPGTAGATPKPAEPMVTQVAARARKATAQVKDTHQGLKRGSKRFGEAVWGPFVKLSGVLWLELTGVFFGIFALFAGLDAWKQRANVHSTNVNHQAHVHFLLACGVAGLFGYFFVSSFVKAHVRGKR